MMSDIVSMGCGAAWGFFSLPTSRAESKTACTLKAQQQCRSQEGKRRIRVHWHDWVPTGGVRSIRIKQLQD